MERGGGTQEEREREREHGARGRVSCVSTSFVFMSGGEAKRDEPDISVIRKMQRRYSSTIQ